MPDASPIGPLVIGAVSDDGGFHVVAHTERDSMRQKHRSPSFTRVHARNVCLCVSVCGGVCVYVVLSCVFANVLFCYRVMWYID